MSRSDRQDILAYERRLGQDRAFLMAQVIEKMPGGLSELAQVLIRLAEL